MRLIGPNALGVANTDPAIAAQRHPGAGTSGARQRSASSASRALWASPSSTRPRRPAAGPVDVRLRRQPRRPVRQRPAAVLGHRPGDRGGAAVPRELRQPAQVLPDRPPGGAQQADRGGEERTPCRTAGPRGTYRRDGRHHGAQALFEQAGVIQVESIAQLFDCGSALRLSAAARRAAGRRRRQLHRSRRARGRRRTRRRIGGAGVGGPRAAGEPGRVRRGRGARIGFGEHRCGHRGVRAAGRGRTCNRSPRHCASGLRIRQARGDDIPRHRGHPATFSPCGIPPATPTRGSVPSYPGPERAAKALARAWRYAKWRSRPQSQVVRPAGDRSRTCPRARPGVARDHSRGPVPVRHGGGAAAGVLRRATSRISGR